MPDVEHFKFSEENIQRANKISISIVRYPKGHQAAAVLPLLDLFWRKNDNRLPLKAMDYVAESV